jgi:hypothetical protein
MTQGYQQRIWIGLVVLAVLLVASWQIARYVTERFFAKSTTGTQITLDQPFELKPGQVAKLSDAKLTVTFDSIAEDSRCPKDVVCFWEGQAVAKATIAQNETTETLDFTSRGNQYTLGIQQVGDYTVKLQQITPYPETQNAKLNKDRYRATFVVSGR